MRIAYLSASLIPSRTANSVHVMKICQAFARAGHQVTLYALGRGDPREDFSFYGVEPSFEVVKWERRPIHRWNRQGAYTRAVRREVLRRPLPDLFFARRIRSLAAVGGLGLPLVYDAHEPPRTRVQKFREGRVFARPNFVRLVVTSRTLAQEYRRHFPSLDPGKIVVVPNGADPPPLPGGRQGEDDPRRFRAGYVGSLLPGRGIEVVMALASRMPEVEFHLVGGSEEEVERWRAASPSANLHYHGFVPHGAVAEQYRALDVVLAPYQQVVHASGKARNMALWMSPLKLFEYMAMRKPMVCSDLPVLRELLENGRNALLVAPDDVDGWERAVRRLAADAVLREALAGRAHEELVERYTWERRAERVLEGLG